MPWQTVDARPQKRRKGDAVEDAERRELRLRRTYNEAAAGHAALAAKAASAPPADAVAALYEKILEDVGSAAKENEAPWDAALRLACARHLQLGARSMHAPLRTAHPPKGDPSHIDPRCASAAGPKLRRACPVICPTVSRSAFDQRVYALKHFGRATAVVCCNTQSIVPRIC